MLIFIVTFIQVTTYSKDLVVDVKDCYLQTLQIVYKRSYGSVALGL